MIKVAIAGGTGYTAGELLRLLLNHPFAEVVAVLSSSLAGESVCNVHRDLTGDTSLRFTSSLQAEGGKIEPDMLFLTLGHGLSASYLDSLELAPGCRVIDLGNDFRLGQTYKGNEFVYGLCEMNRESIKGALNVANPGCFATAILLSLIPLKASGFLENEVHIHGITGSTGAGKSLSESTHFSYRDSNISVYKPFVHQHLGEIKKTLEELSPSSELPSINFIPMRGDFTRGIFTSLYTKVKDEFNVAKAISFFEEYYADSPFVHLSLLPLSLKEVVNTNKALIHIEKHNNNLHITAVIDNLLKGASGQAVQNMNIMFGLEESCGLRLKGSAF
ncbi:MAG: N-acetyl-gamma-glutamyl-phosphate reductase [Rikenellaceae bacterium]|nr:N-acetyl-gamma-glutamyl-phosphate reductase [Rikenellaceae bacterium]